MPETFSTFNQRAATFSSILAALAIMLAAVITFMNLRQDAAFQPPNGPRDLSAAGSEAGTEPPVVLSLVSYETQAIQSVAEPALSQIAYDWESELDGWSIQFLGPNGRVSGYTWSAEKKIEVFVKDGSTTERLVRVLTHELGHAVDVSKNTGDERRVWLAQRNAAENTPWWPVSGAADFETGAGDFAEVFAAWEVGTEDFRSVVGKSPTDSDYQLMGDLALR